MWNRRRSAHRRRAVAHSGIAGQAESWSGRIRSVCACLANGLRYARREDWLEELEEAREIALDTGATATLRGILARLMDSPPPATEEISAVVGEARRTGR
ncbi:MAG: hypothetical protein IPL59_15940 [Candidatus Competibacteraceae bacterium]|nr:hypothetical protein [Candidatus Competibacteraceae bacterium]